MRQLSLAITAIALKPSFIKGFSPLHHCAASKINRFSAGPFTRLHLFGLGPIEQNSKSNVSNTKDNKHWPDFFEEILELATYEAEALEINSQLKDYACMTIITSTT